MVAFKVYARVWPLVPQHLLSIRCNILIHRQFLVHMRCIHKWNTYLYMPPRLHSTSFIMYCATPGQGGIQEWDKQIFTFAHGGGSIILCKPECYTRMATALHNQEFNM